VLDGAKIVSKAIRPGEYAKNARHFQRGALVDLREPRMRMRRTDHRSVGLARKTEIIAEFAAAGQQTRIFIARQRLADEAKFLIWFVHRRVERQSGRTAVDRKIGVKPTFLQIR
jgi:hypothetical protein